MVSKGVTIVSPFRRIVMTSTTSLKLPDELKAQIAEAAKDEGKTSHALMIDALQMVMDETRMRKQFYREAMEAKADMIRTNISYSHEEIAKWMRARVRGDMSAKPMPQAYDPSQPMRPALRNARI
jgi:predicted transcriptional regulator